MCSSCLPFPAAIAGIVSDVGSWLMGSSAADTTDDTSAPDVRSNKMNQEYPHEHADKITDISTTDAAIVRAMRSMRGYSAFALLGSIYEVAARDEGFLGTLEIALSIVDRLPGVRVEKRSPIEQTRVFSDYWVPR
jgi:hypothetical protein